jgi:hypothetical protein
MDILWHPEKGFCPCCRGPRTTVRGFSTGKAGGGCGAYIVMCFPCWNRMQVGTLVSSKEWKAREVIVFRSEPSSRQSQAPSVSPPN